MSLEALQKSSKNETPSGRGGNWKRITVQFPSKPPHPEGFFIMFINLIGERFGRLLVLSRTDNKGTHAAWICRCDCGEETIVSSASLKTGHTKSCGCLKHNSVKYGTHRHCSNGASKTYVSYRAMLERCYNKKNASYKNYGGRGIVVCERWLGENGFANFLADMGERTEGKTLDRFPDKNGIYEASNCRWATDKEQARNRKGNVTIEYNGNKKIMSEWAEFLSVDQRNFFHMLKRHGFEYSYNYYKNKKNERRSKVASSSTQKK
ncbi:MAG TPA: hypothetical protein PLX17_00575 [Chitinophagaceae bacterium]|nr:hypothetical protein [Chitinophagaceae bacterium]